MFLVLPLSNSANGFWNVERKESFFFFFLFFSTCSGFALLCVFLCVLPGERETVDIVTLERRYQQEPERESARARERESGNYEDRLTLDRRFLNDP